MYSRQEASAIRRKFWTLFGQYLRPVKNAAGETTNWVNYKTGIKNIFFRMDAGKDMATIAIEISYPDEEMRREYYGKILPFKEQLHGIMNENWQWQEDVPDEHGKPIARIWTGQRGVSIFKEEDWPAIISFLKPRLIGLDRWWQDIKDFM